MKRVLITGATGFVGSNLARRLVADGHEVSLLVRRQSDLWRIADIVDRMDVHAVGITDSDPVRDAVSEIKPQWIFHCAVYGAYSWQTDWKTMLETNSTGTINLVEACLATGFEAFINTGSSSEYGYKDHPAVEDERVDPNSYYAVTKASATQYCGFVARDRNVHISTLRLYSVYGPYEEPNRFVPTLTVRGIKRELPPLVDPSIARDYVHIDDVVEAYLLAAAAPAQDASGVYNVGSGTQTSIAQAVDIARRLFDIDAEPQWGSMPNRLWDTNVWVADNTKIKSDLGWQPRHSFADGLERFAAWFKANPDMLAHYSGRVSEPPRVVPMLKRGV